MVSCMSVRNHDVTCSSLQNGVFPKPSAPITQVGRVGRDTEKLDVEAAKWCASQQQRNVLIESS